MVAGDSLFGGGTGAALAVMGVPTTKLPFGVPSEVPLWQPPLLLLTAEGLRLESANTLGEAEF